MMLSCVDIAENLRLFVLNLAHFLTDPSNLHRTVR